MHNRKKHTEMSARGKSTKNFKAKLHVFLDRTTLHGAHYLGQTNYHWFRRFAWICIVLACAFGAVFLISLKIRHYFRLPVETQTSITSASNLSFPAVTICNINPFRWSYAQRVPGLAEIFRLTYGPPQLTRGKFQNFSSVDVCSLTGQGYLEDMNNTELAQLLEEAAPTLQETFQECKWRRFLFNCSEYFEQQWTEEGRCFTFNGAKFVSRYGMPIHTDLVGQSGGLRVRINISQSEYGYGPHNSAGVKVLVHEPTDIPLIGPLGLAIGPGTETYIGVQKNVIQALPAPYEGSICRDTKDPNFVNPLTLYNNSYKQSACLLECEAKFLMATCNCRMVYHKGSAPVCDPIDVMNCSRDALVEFTAGDVAGRCQCFQECDVTQYDLQISSASFPSNFILSEIERQLNVSEKDVKDNLLALQVYYIQLNLNVIKQVGAYNLETLIADVGGLLGILLGASVITLLETLDFLGTYSWQRMADTSPTPPATPDSNGNDNPSAPVTHSSERRADYI